jgi:uncharacterized protein YvpB
LIYKKIIVLGILLGTGSLVHSSHSIAPLHLVITEAAEASAVHRTILIGFSTSSVLVEAHTPDTKPLRAKAETKEQKKGVRKVTKKNVPAVTSARTTPSSKVFSVPFYSQFSDITSTVWKKSGCGVTSLAMLIDFYKPGTVKVDTLLKEGITAGAYLQDAGWTHAGLIGLSKKYGFGGQAYDMGGSTMDTAFTKLTSALNTGPVMASVHYSFDPQSPIPHLVVINGVKDGMVYYNDPAEKGGGGAISITKFQKSWKKRYIEIRPLT